MPKAMPVSDLGRKPSDRMNPGAQESASSRTEHLVGLHREIWQGIDTDAYLQRERDAWLPSIIKPNSMLLVEQGERNTKHTTQESRGSK